MPWHYTSMQAICTTAWWTINSNKVYSVPKHPPGLAHDDPWRSSRLDSLKCCGFTKPSSEWAQWSDHFVTWESQSQAFIWCIWLITLVLTLNVFAEEWWRPIIDLNRLSELLTTTARVSKHYVCSTATEFEAKLANSCMGGKSVKLDAPSGADLLMTGCS